MNTWCPNCIKGKACRIYDTRPPSCAAYECLWLYTQSFEDPTLRLPERCRPDHTKVVIDIYESSDYRAALCWIDLSYPDAINSEVNQSLIKMLSEEHVVIEARGQKRKVLAINQSTAKKMVQSGFTPKVGEELVV
jgi:hypothetical protein